MASTGLNDELPASSPDSQSGVQLQAIGLPSLRRRFAVECVVSIAPQPHEILTREEVAAWLKVKPRQVERLGVPAICLGTKTKRYQAGDVIAFLETKKKTPLNTRALRRPRQGV